MKNLPIILILVFATILRLYSITTVPPSLFGDELDVGYHAYSILKTGRDYSGNFMPLHFQSLAEWRTPFYLYSAVPTVALFGITPLGVRLPAVFFGVLSILGFYLLVKKITNHKTLALIASLLLTISPWHLQYSRAGFEVTMLLTFLLLGLYYFLNSLKDGKYLWLSGALLVLTPMIYSTAKLFTPILMLFLIVFYRKEIFSLSKSTIRNSLFITLALGGLVAYATLFSGGSQRFGYISVFTDPVIEPEVGFLRLKDARNRGENGVGLKPHFIDRLIHNKYTYVFDRMTSNYITSLGTEFMFVNGDPNPRHMMDKMGMFYKIELIALILGLIFFAFTKHHSRTTKNLIFFWILAGIIPAAITRDGGNHATRLILILPPLLFLISYGVLKIFDFKRILGFVYILVLLIGFGTYLHGYYVHYPTDSERWWHSGWGEAIGYIKENDGNYDRVFVTMADEPAWIFFASHYQYDPVRWHRGFPMKGTMVPGFGGLSYIDKYYFGALNENGASLYDLSKFITSKDLYLASAKEIPWNLVVEPSKVPQGLKMLHSVSYKSGDPAFYIFTKE